MVIGDTNGAISFFKEGANKVSNAQLNAHKVNIFEIVSVLEGRI